MFGIFKRKRCKQCGEDLRMFTNVDFCTLYCAFRFEYPNGVGNPWMVGEMPYSTFYALQDILYEIHKRKPTKLEVANCYLSIPEHIHNEVLRWGWDTEVKEKCYTYLKGEMANE